MTQLNGIAVTVIAQTCYQNKTLTSLIMRGRTPALKLSAPDTKLAVAEILAGWNLSLPSQEFGSCQPLTLLNWLVDGDSWRSEGVQMCTLTLLAVLWTGLKPGMVIVTSAKPAGSTVDRSFTKTLVQSPRNILIT